MIMMTLDQFWKFLNTVRKKSFTEIILCLFFLVLILAYYCVNVFHILPCMYQLPSVLYLTHMLSLTFMVFNLLANFLAVMYADSSVIGRLLTISKYTSKEDITYCYVCQCDVPLRCWHCDICNVCILTRDHHCTFSTTCVGHYNRRYFLWFLLYLSVASFYEIILISYYTYYKVTIKFSDLMVLVPFQSVLTGFHLTAGEIFVVLLTLNFIAVTISSLLLIYHLDKVCKGLVCHEKQESNYDFGLMRNLETVFGEKWYITWISPFIESKLPYNGIDWQSHVNQYKTK
ncbi:probable palmitoyltransferase ZDHHC24 isoform X1 [Aphis gossypii]|uniref:probable palmitoyltransferase ZDHHC24 isoform X1 n=1 Tax=Aphis gossypii TaxID=80765 RepID=UPI00100E4D4A|nr:probable palmitoyltransferase ZDHHC24 isoform X1 [Aphis gossypii]XP_050061818.1 probable palmitoyltransferase ZDHHC24 isoform X1 [Aphis gossypii]